MGLKPDQGRVLKAVMVQTSTTSSTLAQHALDHLQMVSSSLFHRAKAAQEFKQNKFKNKYGNRMRGLVM